MKKIDEMTLEEIEARLAEIGSEVETRSGEELEKLESEVVELQTRKAELVDIETRQAQAEALQSGEIEADKIIEKREEMKTMEEKKVFGRDTQEYRDAFFANLVGKATVEQRTIFADNTTAGDGIALPVATDTAIWDQVLTAHPILADIAIVKSGIVMKVSQMTPNNLGTGAGVKGKKDSDAVVGLTFTTNEKVLAGKDYATYVELSYAEAKMSQGAMEAFLVSEIAAALGELLAKDVFAAIKTDAPQTTATASKFVDIKTALGNAVQASNPVIYAPSALYYAILGEVDTNGQPIVRDGVVLGAPLKKDNAAVDITVVDPAMVICNVVADTQIKSTDDVKNAAFVIGGYMRAEACLRKTAAASVIY